jgi:hypothetical protein
LALDSGPVPAGFLGIIGTLDDADRAAIAALPKTQRLINPGFGPAWDPVR